MAVPFIFFCAAIAAAAAPLDHHFPFDGIWPYHSRVAREFGRAEGSPSAMECIAIINQKGGVGKTSTTVNLGAALAERGQRVLLIDLDPQGHLTTHLGLDGEAKGAGIYEVLTTDMPLASAIHLRSPNISIVPAQIDLAAAEMELVSVVGREVILRDLIYGAAWPFDIALIDCPPSLGVLTLNALAASTRVLVPLQPHFLALQGVGKLLETVSLVSRRINPGLTVAGMVITMYETGTRLSGEVIDDLSAFLESARNTPVPWSAAKVFDAKIRRNVKLAESPSYGQSIFEYAPRSNGALDYLALAEELAVMLAGNVAADPVDGSETRQSAQAAVANYRAMPTAPTTAADKLPTEALR